MRQAGTRVIWGLVCGPIVRLPVGGTQMPRIVHHALDALTAKALAAKGAPGRHADGAGLYLHVTAPGQAKWSLR